MRAAQVRTRLRCRPSIELAGAAGRSSSARALHAQFFSHPGTLRLQHPHCLPSPLPPCHTLVGAKGAKGPKRPFSQGMDPASPVGPARARAAAISPAAGAPGHSRARRGARPQRLAQRIATSGHPGRGQRPGRRLQVLGGDGGAEAGPSAEAWAHSPVCPMVAKPPRG